MLQIQRLMRNIIQNGDKRGSRAGETISLFSPPMLVFDLQNGFPVVTAKKLAWKAMVGELLWFLGAETSTDDLKKRSNLDPDKKTIWCPDLERWNRQRGDSYKDNTSLGNIYGKQWRMLGYYDSYGDYQQVDQIGELVRGLKEDPYGRRHIVNSWNVADLAEGLMALPPCHCFFQCYVTSDGFLDLHWHQRSADLFLGTPFNISSYALLLVILAKITGYKPRKLTCSLGDAHIYTNQLDAVKEYLNKVPVESNFEFDMPEITCLEDLSELTAKDFPIINYDNLGTIKAPLSVG